MPESISLDLKKFAEGFMAECHRQGFDPQAVIKVAQTAEETAKWEAAREAKLRANPAAYFASTGKAAPLPGSPLAERGWQPPPAGSARALYRGDATQKAEIARRHQMGGVLKAPVQRTWEDMSKLERYGAGLRGSGEAWSVPGVTGEIIRSLPIHRPSMPRISDIWRGFSGATTPASSKALGAGPALTPQQETDKAMEQSRRNWTGSTLGPVPIGTMPAGRTVVRGGPRGY